MTYHHRYDTQLPRGPPRAERVELNVLQVDPDGNALYGDDYDADVCDCFPRPSKKTIPSMLYDRIKCPHKHEKHIQPGQKAVFTHPWTASSDENKVKGPRVGYRHGRQLRPIEEHDIFDERDVPNAIRTAPPYAVVQTSNRIEPPFTAPAPGEELDIENDFPRRAESEPYLQSYRSKIQYSRRPTQVSRGRSEQHISTPFVDWSEPTHDRVHRQATEPFIGHYKDPSKFNSRTQNCC